MAAWRYCGKEDTRVEGPMESGVPPAARNVKGDVKEHNEMIISGGLVRAVDEGLIPIEKYTQLRRSLDLYQIDKHQPVAALGVRGLWYYGAPGTGKSHSAINDLAKPQYRKSQNKWFDGYKGEPVIILDDLDH